MDILDEIEEPEAAGTSTNFGGPGEYMMMDTDDVDSATPELPRRTEESKQLLGSTSTQEPMEDAMYSEPAPVWNSSPSSRLIDTIFFIATLCFYRASKNR